MKNRSNFNFNLMMFGLMAAEALYFFISSRDSLNSTFWNALVVIQFFVALGGILWNWKRKEQ